MADTLNPTISVISPQPNSKNNPVDSQIHIEFNDPTGLGSGLSLFSLNLIVSGQYAFRNGILQAGFDGYIDGYHGSNILDVYVTRQVDFDPLEVVNVAASIRDLTSNPAATRVYSFIALDNVAPQITNIVPADGTGQVDINQPIQFSLRTTPLETQVNINTLIVTISGLEVDAYGDLILDGYGNPIEVDYVRPDSLGLLIYDRRQVSITEDQDGLGYSINIVPLNLYPLASKIAVNVYVEDFAGNALTTNFAFTTSDDKAPILLNPLPAPQSVGNSIASAISFTLGDQQGSFPGSGLDLNSVAVTIDGKKAIEAGVGQVGFIISTTPNPSVNGYDFVIAANALFAPRKTINVNIVASDNNFNVLATNYVFTTADVTAPQISFVSPRTGATTNLPQNTTLIIDVKSEVAVGEIDIASVTFLVNGTPAFANNSFQSGFSGLAIATTPTILTFTLTPINEFALGDSIILDAYASDIFQNSSTNSISFSITTNITLKSSIFPSPGIYDKTNSSLTFPGVGSFIDAILTSNDPSALIAYTVDGSDPAIDGYFSPLGTTQTYTTPIRISNPNGAVVRYFAFNSFTNTIEPTNNAVYVFSYCPEVDKWDDFALQDGLEYTSTPTFKQITYEDSSLFSAARLGLADYIHDLGRTSFIDVLEFGTTGTTRFRVRVADSLDTLKATPWLNALQQFTTNNLVDLVDGYGSTITSSPNNAFQVSGQNLTGALFGDESYAQINQTLFESFTVNADMRLSATLDALVGAKSFLRIYDDSHTLEVQQYVSKINNIPNSQLDNQNSLVGETTKLYVNNTLLDSYSVFTDGYDGLVELIQPPQQVIETINFFETQVLKFDAYDAYDLPSKDIVQVISSTDSIYNQFIYSDAYDGYTYSSALVKAVYYKRFEAPARTSFAIPIIGKALDSTIAVLKSENLISTTDSFQPAETNNVFSTSIFLEPGDYNFRYYITRSNDSRTLSNPYQFTTKQNLSLVQANDKLVANFNSYTIASVVRLIDGSYSIEFEKEFPQSTLDIASWSIVRNTTTVIFGATPIVVENLSQAQLGYDPEGLVANLVINERKQVQFTYISSTATKVAVIGTFNDFNTTTNVLVEQLNPIEIEKVFDGDYSTYYENNHTNFHKTTITPQLPLIVDRVQFRTNVDADAYQRTTLLLDDKPIARSNYTARDAYGSPINYLNNLDIYTHQSQVYSEWKYVQILNNKNRTLRSSIGLLTRFDTIKEQSRKHVELDIFTLPNVPLLTTDYFALLDEDKLYRKDKSGFASIGNEVSIIYGTTKQLSSNIVDLLALQDNGLVNNFLQANIITNDFSLTNTVYVDNPTLFSVGDKIITFDGSLILRSTITNIINLSGQITCDSTIHSEGIMVRDYFITENEDSFMASIEVPVFTIAFMGVISSFIPSPTQTIVTFEDVTNTNIAQFVGGKFTYPLLDVPARILEASKFQQLVGSNIVNYIKITIDKELLFTNNQLGAIVEVFNSSQTVTDYVIGKDGYGECLNNSELCVGTPQIIYETNTPAYQAPSQMYCFDIDGYSDVVKLEVIPTLQSVTLRELEQFNINFFNGVESQAPASVIFTVNDAYSYSQSLNNTSIVDGYLEGYYDPLFANTGQIVQFSAPIEYFINDGYQDTLLTKLTIEFSGQLKYCIGELKTLVDSTLVNSRCRIIVDDQELFLSSLPISNTIFSRYQIQIDRGSLLVFFNGELVLNRPILFINPKFEFGGTGKVLDDSIQADFRNIYIDQYFNTSPATIQQVGRFIEIEGTVVS